MALDKKQNWLRQLFVDPSCQRAGIGRRLLDDAKQEMPQGFWLRTTANNLNARQFYEKAGLRFDGLSLYERYQREIAIFRWP
ncbi:GNAT family N-acetyltransferase [Acetobacter senegalensis]